MMTETTRPWGKYLTPELIEREGHWCDYAAWQQWLTGMEELEDVLDGLDGVEQANLYALMCDLADGSKSDIERSKAEAISSAADTACNQWNALKRTKSWCNMTPEFQQIWLNLRELSRDHHRMADDLKEQEGI